MELLLQSVPPRVEMLTLRFRGATLEDADVEALAEALAQLPGLRGPAGDEESSSKRTVRLDLKCCEDLEEVLPAFNVLKEAGVTLDLDVQEVEAVKGGEDARSKALGRVLGMNLVREGVQLKRFQKRVEPAVPALVNTLLKHDIPGVRKAAAQALGQLSQAAIDALPALQQAAEDDYDESVKRAAAFAIAKVTGSAHE